MVMYHVTLGDKYDVTESFINMRKIRKSTKEMGQLCCVDFPKSGNDYKNSYMPENAHIHC